jgi:proteasome activator subunit 4
VFWYVYSAAALADYQHTSGAVFSALDDKLFDGVLEQIYEYVTTTARGNAVDAVGELVRNMSAANSDKVFARLFPVAKQRILAELKAGASSTRTTTTSIPLASDAALHWWQSILYGMLVPGRLSVRPARSNVS